MAGASGLTAGEFAEIQNLYGLYNHCSDAGDAEGYADCFTPDGAMLAPGLDLAVRGRAGLIAHKQRDLAGRGGAYRRHWNGSLHLQRIDQTTVRGRCYLLAYNGQPGSLPTLADCGVYQDTIALVDGAWKFAERILTMDASTWSKAAEPAGDG